MTDDLSKRGPADASQVNVNEEWELRYWSARFRCTEDELKAAVSMVGTKVADLEVHFEG